jgi:Icc-related predicted phosphoesterase
MGSASLKDDIGFTEVEVERAMSLGPADVLLVHEWPEGLIDAPSLASGGAVGYRPVGNAPARLLVELLSPKLVLAGHMHERHRGAIGSSPVVCLASVHQAMESIAVFEATPGGAVAQIG